MAKKAKPKPESDGGSAEDAPKAGGRKKLIIIAAAAVLLVGGGGGAWFMMKPAGGEHGGSEHGGSGGHGGGHGGEGKKQVAFVDVGEMVVNLAPEPNQERPRYLKLKVALEVKDEKIVGDVQPLMPRVQDIFQVFVRELRVSDLEGSGGIYRLREELLRRVNLAVSPSRIDAVLFKEVVVQ